MATWQLGPFDNDDAVEWCITLEETPLDQRVSLVRQTLADAAEPVSTLTMREAAWAIAAAAVVLQALTGVPASDSAYAPRFLLNGQNINVDKPLGHLAVQALSVVLARDSPWRLQWSDDVEEDEAVGVIETLKADLVRSTG